MLKMRKKQGKRQRNIKSILAVPIFSSCMFWPAKFSKRFNKKILYFTLVFFCFFLLPWSWSEWLPFGGPRLCNAIWKCKNTNMYENRNTQIQKPWLYKAIWKWGVHIGSSTAGALGTKLPRLPCLRSKKSIFFWRNKTSNICLWRFWFATDCVISKMYLICLCLHWISSDLLQFKLYLEFGVVY